LVEKNYHADVSVFKMFKVIILKEKTICEYLNMLRSKDGDMVATGLVWCPKSFDFTGEVGKIAVRLSN